MEIQPALYRCGPLEQRKNLQKLSSSRASSERVASAPRYGWLLIPFAAFIVAGILLLSFADSRDRPAAVSAVVVAILAVILSYCLIKRHPVTGLIPAIFMLAITARTSLPTLYFSIFSPSASVSPGGTAIRLLDSNVEFQFATLLSLSAIAVPWLVLQSRQKAPFTYDGFLKAAVAVESSAFILFATMAGLLVVLRIAIVGPETPIGYLVYGAFRYTQGLPLLTGAAWGGLRARRKTLVLVTLAANLAFNSIANSRAYGFLPIMFLFVGVLFLSQVGFLRKLTGAGMIFLVLAVSLVVGNASRRMGLGLWYGGAQDLRNRIDVISERSNELIPVNWADEIFIRLFFNGGHELVMFFPNAYPFKPLDPAYFTAEVVTNAVLPRGIATLAVPPIYEEKSSLLSIGHRLTSHHSVERSFVGAGWELGGYGPVAMISLLTGCYMLVIVALLFQLFSLSRGAGVFAFAVVLDRTLTSINEGLPSLAHELLYALVIGATLSWGVHAVAIAIGRRRLVDAHQG